LKIGEITAVFISSGKIPVSIDWLKILTKDGAMMSAESFSNFGEIL
jgi:hypothetical protein